jgi:hypothetical protein
MTPVHAELLTSIRALGMSHVKKPQLEKALAVLYPNETLPNDQAVLVKEVFVYLHRQESSDKQGQ